MALQSCKKTKTGTGATPWEGNFGTMNEHLNGGCASQKLPKQPSNRESKQKQQQTKSH